MEMMKMIGKHKNIINLLGACTQDGMCWQGSGSCFPASTALVLVFHMAFWSLPWIGPNHRIWSVLKNFSSFLWLAHKSTVWNLSGPCWWPDSSCLFLMWFGLSCTFPRGPPLCLSPFPVSLQLRPRVLDYLIADWLSKFTQKMRFRVQPSPMSLLAADGTLACRTTLRVGWIRIEGELAGIPQGTSPTWHGLFLRHLQAARGAVDI